MSGEDRRTGAPQGPPWSLDLLADLHAGVLDEQTADELRSQVQDDPEAREILAALDATSEDLAELPPLTIPDDVSVRIDAALENEVREWAEQQQHADVPTAAPAAPAAEQGAQVIDFAAAKQRRRRRFTLGAGLVGVAAAAAAVVFTAMPSSTEVGTQQAQPPSSSAPGEKPPLALQGDQVHLNGQQFAEVFASRQYQGALNDPQQLIGCLQANGVTSGKPLGAREITLDGKPAQLLVLPGGETGKFRLLAVAPDCGPDNPAKISDSTFGG